TPGNDLRTAARILAFTAPAAHRRSAKTELLINALITLISTITHLHRAQANPPQESASTRCLDHLKDMSHNAERQPWESSPTELAMQGFPIQGIRTNAEASPVPHPRPDTRSPSHPRPPRGPTSLA